MNWLKHFGAFWYDFIVGDSPVIAIGVIVTIPLTALLVRSGMDGLAPVIFPILVGLTLATSLDWL
jgi:hypothetical protein